MAVTLQSAHWGPISCAVKAGDDLSTARNERIVAFA